MPAGTGARTSAISAAIAAARAARGLRRRAPRAPPRTGRRRPGEARLSVGGRHAAPAQRPSTSPFSSSESAATAGCTAASSARRSVATPGACPASPSRLELHPMLRFSIGMHVFSLARLAVSCARALTCSTRAARRTCSRRRHHLVADERPDREPLAGRAMSSRRCAGRAPRSELHPVAEIAHARRRALARPPPRRWLRCRSRLSVSVPTPPTRAMPTLSCARASAVSSTTGNSR